MLGYVKLQYFDNYAYRVHTDPDLTININMHDRGCVYNIPITILCIE